MDIGVSSGVSFMVDGKINKESVIDPRGSGARGLAFHRACGRLYAFFVVGG
jgi:hypothetical protein